jgi:hypothetical protein
MLRAFSQPNGYQPNLNNAVLQAVSGAKPDLVTQNRKLERSVAPAKSPVGDRMKLTVNMESINKAIDAKIAEFFSKYPNGGSDRDVALFLEGVKLAGG